MKWLVNFSFLTYLDLAIDCQLMTTNDKALYFKIYRIIRDGKSREKKKRKNAETYKLSNIEESRV